MTYKRLFQTTSTACVEVVYSPYKRQTVSVIVALAPEGKPALTTVRDVIMASQIAQNFPEVNITMPSIGIWGQKISLTDPVHPGERIEIYRPLIADPKESRRLRYKKQGPVQSRHRPGYKGP